MQTLITNYRRLLDTLGLVYTRQVFQRFETSHRILGIVGSRGVGKTTYLLHYLKTNHAQSTQALYISADDLYFSNHTLVALADQFVREYDGKLLVIDEIHRYHNWAQELKNLFDQYKQLQIIFSGSSTIDLIKQQYDLSRRGILETMPGFSFREYLEFQLHQSLPLLNLESIVEQRITSYSEITSIPKLGGYWKQYLRTGYYPFTYSLSTERDQFKGLQGIVDKTIQIDIASYYTLKTPTLSLFNKILWFIFSSKPSSVNVHRIAQSLQKDYKDVEGYLDMLEDSNLLRYLLIDKLGHALIRNAQKAYLNNPNLYFALEYSLGKQVEVGIIRELAVIVALQEGGYKPFYSKIGDIRCDQYIFEIGGKNKATKQLQGESNAFLVKDDLVYGDKDSIPLYLFGFLY